MFSFIFGLLVGVLGILVASMRSGVKFCAEWCSREVEGTILDPLREKNVRNVPAPKYANAEYKWVTSGFQVPCNPFVKVVNLARGVPPLPDLQNL